MGRTVGIDLGLKTRHRAVIYEDHTRRDSLAFDVTDTGISELLRRATDGFTGSASFVMEPTGLAWVPVASRVKAAGHDVFLIKPQKVSDLRKFARKHTKSDIVDADALARLPLLDPDGCYPAHIPSSKQHSLRRCVSRRERLVSENARAKQRIHALLVEAHPKLMSVLGEDKFTQASLAFLTNRLDPRKVVRAGPKRLKVFWNKHSRGKVSEERVEAVFEACEQAVKLYDDLRASGELPFDYEDLQLELAEELQDMKRREATIARLEERMRTLYASLDPARTLEQIPGIGPVIAASIEAIVGSISRFPSAKRFASYCGLVPRKKKSGLADPAMPITKAGHPLLKKYLYLAAEVARQHDPDFAVYYARRYRMGQPHKRIVVALARKMAVRVYAVLTRREADGEARYVLRDDEHQEIVPAEARKLIRSKFSRAAIDAAASKPGTEAAQKSGRPKTPQATDTAPGNGIL